MRIAILGSVVLPVPPPKQGGTEWIAYYQAKGLSDLGHKIILFAARGSVQGENYELFEVGRDTLVEPKLSSVKPDQDLFGISSFASPALQSHSPRGQAIIDQAIDTESSRGLRKENVYLAEVIEELIKRKDDYDIILNNMRGEAVLLPLAKMLDKPFVNIMHLPLFRELADLFSKYNTHIITVSNAQRNNFPGLNYLATIYNCVDTDKFLFEASPQDYLLMMGTIGRHKNQKAAIKVAKNLGMKLILAGKIRDFDYYKELEKDIDGEKIRWVGELGFEEKLRLYQNAKALLFPVLWEEPFGLVMIEAMACGTPVVAYKNGAIPEVIVDGETGFVIENNTEEEMTEAVKKIDTIKRKNCRKHVMENFTVEKMVRNYEAALKKILPK